MTRFAQVKTPRHSCDDKKDKTTPGFWSCYQWRAGAKVDN